MASLFNVNTNETVNAHVGPALLFYAAYGVTFPTGVGSVVNLSGSSQWQPKTNWTAFGATKTGIKVERGFTKVDRLSDTSFGPYDHRPNHWTATLTSELLETTPTNLRIGWEGGQIATSQAYETTTLSAAAAAGASAVVVTSIGTLASGSVISIGGNLTQEWHTLSAVSGTTGTFGGETLLYAQASGEPVVLPSIKSFGFGHPRSITPRQISVIAPLVTVSASLKANVDLFRMWSFRNVRLGEGNRTMNLSQDNDWVLPTSFHCYRDTTITDETIDTFVVYEWGLS